MYCEEARGLFEAYLTDMLTPEAKAKLTHHLRSCSDCSAKLQEAEDLLRKTDSVLKWALPAGGFEGRAKERVLEAAVRRETSWGEAFREQCDRAPWWMISAAIHAAILMLMTIVTWTTGPKPMKAVIIETEFIRKAPIQKPKQLPFNLFDKLSEVESDHPQENPIFKHEDVEIDENPETINDAETRTARGEEDAISDIPLGGKGVVGSIGMGGGGAGCFGTRSPGGRRRAVRNHGGTRQSESSVNAALRWLAVHQEPDGRWDTQKYGARNRADTGISGLAVLAFLGAGHTERAGEYRQNVRAGVKWLMDVQRKHGKNCVYQGKGVEPAGYGPGYHHAIAGLALAEAYGMARNPIVGTAAQKAIDYSVGQHQKEYSGWRYSARTEPDTSVTGWFIMQLKSARVAGLRIDGKGFAGAQAWLDSVEDKNEYQGYRGGRFSYQPGRQPARVMTAAGMLGRLFMGAKPDVLRGGGEELLENLPSWNRKHFYYWYYGTLVMFQMGGDYWKAWNPAMRDMLVANQRPDGDERGSWDPVPQGGGSSHSDYNCRVMSTALGALCLEVYYRYLPMTRGD